MIDVKFAPDTKQHVQKPLLCFVCVLRHLSCSGWLNNDSFLTVRFVIVFILF